MAAARVTVTTSATSDRASVGPDVISVAADVTFESVSARSISRVASSAAPALASVDLAVTSAAPDVVFAAPAVTSAGRDRASVTFATHAGTAA